jgi:hypothetical protein
VLSLDYLAASSNANLQNDTQFDKKAIKILTRGIWYGCSVWFGLVWFGLVWFGLVWFAHF